MSSCKALCVIPSSLSFDANGEEKIEEKERTYRIDFQRKISFPQAPIRKGILWGGGRMWLNKKVCM